MVRFFNKDLKSHSNENNEKILELMNVEQLKQFSQLLMWHTRYFSGWSHDKLTHLLQKLTIQLGIDRPTEFWPALHGRKTRLKDLFLTVELILESFSDTLGSGHSYYFTDFVKDTNDFFLINKIPLQIRFFSQKKEFYIEKIISPEVSEKIKETLENFSEQEKIFEDFKEAIKKYSSGDYEGAIEKCCVSIEDYLCLLLEKQTCSSVVQYYKDVSKKLKISDEINDRFVNIIHFIHNHRSPQNHGAIEKKEIQDEELISEIIIGFTMTILNYLKKKNEKS
jgi:hypothetical protein